MLQQWSIHRTLAGEGGGGKPGILFTMFLQSDAFLELRACSALIEWEFSWGQRQIAEVYGKDQTVASRTGSILSDSDAASSAFVDGWFRTGDIGSLDEDGVLTLHGREKELINRGGEMIAPTEIGDVLMRHPAVIEAAAYAVHDPRLGEDVAAAVVLEPGSTVTEDDLRKFLSTQPASIKVPRRIVFQDKLLILLNQKKWIEWRSVNI
jgi:acyl-CoA synthetase (AMP-forming)/AMP-acid ligase II